MATKKSPEAPRDLMAAADKQFGKGTLICPGQPEPPQEIRVIATGCMALDRALGVGGYPRGRIVEIYGPMASGKSTLALHALSGAQRAGGVGAFIDAEHAFDLAYAKAVGVDVERLLVSQPESAEQGLEIVDMLSRSGAVDIIVIDSVGALVPRAEIEGEMSDAHIGLQARLMSQALRKLTATAQKTETALLFLNHLRPRPPGVIFATPDYNAGSNALKFYASVRMEARRIGAMKDGEAVVGARIRAKVVKNKCAPPFTEAEFDLRWGKGIEPADEVGAA